MAKKEQIDEVPKNVLGMLANLNHKLQHGNITSSQLERFLKKQSPFDATITKRDEVFNVTVNRNQTIADGITAGQYDWVHASINDSNFQCTCSGIESTEIILVHFNKVMDIEDVLLRLEKRNLCPADLRELLAIGEQFPDKQKQFIILALGSVWQDSEGIPYIQYLDWNDSKRRLGMDWPAHGWNRSGRFVALRK